MLLLNVVLEVVFLLVQTGLHIVVVLVDSLFFLGIVVSKYSLGLVCLEPNLSNQSLQLLFDGASRNGLADGALIESALLVKHLQVAQS